MYACVCVCVCDLCVRARVRVCDVCVCDVRVRVHARVCDMCALCVRRAGAGAVEKDVEYVLSEASSSSTELDAEVEVGGEEGVGELTLSSANARYTYARLWGSLEQSRRV